MLCQKRPDLVVFKIQDSESFEPAKHQRYISDLVVREIQVLKGPCKGLAILQVDWENHVPWQLVVGQIQILEVLAVFHPPSDEVQLVVVGLDLLDVLTAFKTKVVEKRVLNLLKFVAS